MMLYSWSGKPYRSKQADVAAVEVEEVLEMEKAWEESEERKKPSLLQRLCNLNHQEP